MKPTAPDAARSARAFNTTIEAAKRLFAANAKAFASMADKAAKTRKKVNGYTEAELRQSAAEYLAASK